MRYSEMLKYLSRSSIGHLDIMRVIECIGYQHLASFYSALSWYIFPRQKETHVFPALSMIFNVLKYSRYTSLLETDEGHAYTEFLYLIDDENPRVSRMAKVMRFSLMHSGIKDLSQK